MKSLMLVIALIYSVSASPQEIDFYNKDWQDVRSPIVKINFLGKERLFMIDSGSGISILDSSLKILDDFIMCSNNTSVYTINGNVVEKNSMMYKVKIFDKNVVFFTKDLSYINQVFSDSGIKISGILGADWLLARRVTMDYCNRKIIIGR